MFLRKLSLKIARKLAVKIHAPREYVFLTTSARAHQKHVLHGQEIVSIFIL